MPMGADEIYGTQKDSSKSKDYCKYCYKDGEVILKGSMQDMIEFCVPHMCKANPTMTKDQARKAMQEFFLR